MEKREKQFDIFIMFLLLALGVYHSVLYYGFHPVPNPDFTGFTQVAHELLSFKLPTEWKRAPVLGLMQVLLSYVVGGQHPELTAGWILNSILHPLNCLLIWLISRKLVNKITALFITIIAICNPWMIYALAQPIAEIVLLFFILLATYFIFRRSKWAYLFAAIASMIRYEGAALILAAFVFDMFEGPDKKARIKSFLYSAIASLPLMLWMLGTVLNMQGEGQTHYLKELGAAGAVKETAIKWIEAIWKFLVGIVFIVPSKSQDLNVFVTKLGKILLWSSFLFGSIYGLIKRNFYIITLLILFIPYMFIHVMHSFVLPRFLPTVAWALMIVCIFGLQSLWRIINKNDRIPRPLVWAAQIILSIIFAVWIINLSKIVPQFKRFSPHSITIPFAAIALFVLAVAFEQYVYKFKRWLSDVAILMLISMMLISNQFVLSRIVNDGQLDMEFKRLADWYIANAEPGEKMLSTMSNIAAIFAPKHADSFIHTSILTQPAKDTADFLSKCYDQNITYLAWDSRIGMDIGGRYYVIYHLEHIAALAKPQSIGPFKFITQIKENNGRFINIFRLLPKKAEQIPQP